MIARGNFVVDMNWKDGKLTTAQILSRAGGECIIRTNIPVSIKGKNVTSKTVSLNGETHYLITISTKKGETLQVSRNI